MDMSSMSNISDKNRIQNSLNFVVSDMQHDKSVSALRASDGNPQANMQLPDGMAVTNILKALESWVDAVQASSEFLDKRSCAKVVSEIMQVHKEIKSETFAADPVFLSILLESGFPRRFIEILKDLAKFNESSLKECVTMAFDIEFKMSEGADNAEEKFVAFAKQTATMVEQRREEYEQRKKELDDVRKREQLVADRHKLELQKSKRALLELKSEEERVKRSIAQVNADIAKHMELVERFMKEKEAVPASNPADDARPGQEPDNLSTEQADLQAASMQLNGNRTEINKALENLSVAGDHLSLICHMANFFRETQEFLRFQCNEVLVHSLQEELEGIKQDKEALEHLMEYYKARDEAAMSEEGATSMLPETQRKILLPKYKKFFLEKFKILNVRHAKLRHAAASLVLLTHDESSQQRPGKSISCLSRKLIAAIDELLASVYREVPQPETEEAAASSLTLVLYPKACLSEESCSVVVSSCLEGWQKNQENAPTGQVEISSCEREEDEEFRELRRGLAGGVALSSASNVMGCLLEGVDRVCSGGASHAAVIFSKIVSEHPAAPGEFLPLSLAILHARMRYWWLRSIVVVDAIGSSFVDPLFADPDVKVVSMQDPSLPQDMRRKLEAVESKVRSCEPQLLVVSFEGESQHKHASTDFRALGSSLAKLVSSSPRGGRMMSMWNLKEGGTSMKLTFTNFLLGASEQ
mmetsp:Transcript_12959/g.29801  ORF Transcript_12959/g.29801 Transcript_12959/m.29801 type:complete len:700 (-) Transcript_12959:134-2233(-)